jgi:hypothetical protein
MPYWTLQQSWMRQDASKAIKPAHDNPQPEPRVRTLAAHPARSAQTSTEAANCSASCIQGSDAHSKHVTLSAIHAQLLATSILQPARLQCSLPLSKELANLINTLETQTWISLCRQQ